MDPITLIVSALAAGAAAAAKETAGDAVKDAYKGLKELLQRKFGDNSSARTALAKHESKPQAWRGALEDELKEAAIAEDRAVIEAAQKVMHEVDPKGATMGKYNTTVHGNVYGWHQGDYGTVNIDTSKR